MYHPFADVVGLVVNDRNDQGSSCHLDIEEKHFNPNNVVHGAVLYALADTGMGAAVHHHLTADQLCATIEIKITYFKPVFEGSVQCNTTIINKGKTVVHLESEIFNEDRLVAKANGNFAIFKNRNRT